MTGVMMVASGWETCPSGPEKVRGGMFREEFSIRLPIPAFWYPHSISVENPSLKAYPKAAVKPGPALKPERLKTADPEKPR